jgi:hypothetical protein
MDEFRKAARRINLVTKDKELEAMIEAGDRDRDGFVGRDEFVRFVETQRAKVR